MKSFQVNCEIKENIKLKLRLLHLGYSSVLIKCTDKILFVHNEIKPTIEQALKSVVTNFDLEENSTWCKFIIPDDSELFFSLDQKALWDYLYIKTISITNIELINDNKNIL